MHLFARRILTAFALLLAPATAFAQAIPGVSPEAAAALSRGEWPAYAGTYAAARYAPLTQIDRTNARNLRVVWRWTSPDQVVKADTYRRIGPTRANESTPVMAGGTLYVSTSLSQVAAIDAASGKTKWVFDPKIYDNGLGIPPNDGWLHRGVAYWRAGDDERVLMLTAFGWMYGLDAKTGQPIPTFGTEGRVDLTQGLRRPVDRAFYTMTSPPVIVRGVVVVGSSVTNEVEARASPPGDVRGFDVKSGRLLWTFHTVPQEGEAGVETWANGSWKEAGNTNVSAPMSADEELGYVYLPVSTAANDHYGGRRVGAGLYGESLVCLDAATGKRIWHYQIVHHGLWDYDLPAAPNLVDVTVDGRRIKAVAQVTKQGFVFAFDRVTGKPVWPIEERPVRASSVPGEVSAKTQPIPAKPAPFELQSVHEDNLIDLTPELRKGALEIISKYDYGALYTPPSLRGTVHLGGNWSSAAVDPETGLLYVGSYSLPFLVTLQKPKPGEAAHDYVGTFRPLPGPGGVPLTKPPFGTITAIDLNSGEHRFRIPIGRGEAWPTLRSLRIKQRLGLPMRSWALVTKTVLIVVQMGYFSAPRFQPETRRYVSDLNDFDSHLWVYDKASGEMLAEIPLPSNATGAPMTYMARGRQLIVFPVGGGTVKEELIAVGF